MNRKTKLRILSFITADILVIGILISIYWYSYHSGKNLFVLFGIVAFSTILMRFFSYIITRNQIYYNSLRIIREIINNFKKGKFLVKAYNLEQDDAFTDIIKDLAQTGKYLDNVVSSQKNLIDTFHDLYNSLIFSMSSFLLVIDEEDRVVFANEGFCKKFEFSLKEITGKKLDEIFYIVNAHLRGGIEKARKQQKAVIIEKSHILSIKKISIIADIKISKIIVHGKKQVALVIDDVTSKLRKDYQISLMSQISESIKRDEQIDRILHTMLTGVTSGSGLGFNRAMLFLLNESGNLEGRMAVGPDTFEEAIEIWESIPSFREISEEYVPPLQSRGKKFLAQVVGIKVPIDESNLLTQAVNGKRSIHVNSPATDPRLDELIKPLFDVRECVVVPIVAGDRSVGVLVVDNKFNNVPIGHDSIELLEIFASQAALSIEGYNNLQHLRSELDKLSQRQDAIIESEKMAAVGKIAAHIAHEIRNPLVTMGGYARRIMQLTESPTNVQGAEKIKSASSIILKESERLEKILSNVMDFTKPSKLMKEFNSINDIILDTVELLKNVFLERKIDIELDLHEDIPLIKSDFNQMKQVMLNLFQNAMDAMQEAGTIGVQTTAGEDFVTVRFKDTGSGVKDENPNRVFEPFYTTKVTGVGLGLANVKKIVKDHDGTITVSNTGDGGAEFEMKIPLPG